MAQSPQKELSGRAFDEATFDIVVGRGRTGFWAPCRGATVRSFGVESVRVNEGGPEVGSRRTVPRIVSERPSARADGRYSTFPSLRLSKIPSANRVGGGGGAAPLTAPVPFSKR